MKIGIDWGGTKIEGISIDPMNGTELNRIRVDSPKENYEEIVSKVIEVIKELSKDSKNFTVGIGMPGSIHPETNLVQVSNTKALEGKPVKSDIETKLGYEIKIANDADCLALSEAVDGAGKDYKSVFAVILGTGVGAGYSYDKKIIVGPNKLTGEWGQNPIPGPMDEYEKSVKRHCGRVGAIEVFLSGPGLENYYEYKTKSKIPSREIVSLYQKKDSVAGEVMNVYFERIARSFSSFVNILDPDIIVCGGGMSEIGGIYDEVPKRIIPYIASNFFLTPIVKAAHGSSSGVRGAAHLWN
ncbi:ROK family protein [Acidimicrobiaceae bacterium]|nr:ROK family protein [Acidimicrobiaceae bacterium]|tara:strand:+ start:37 stop:930 length:894 start_codon:yes stop_codon:yes gene_type:complete